MSAPKSNDFTVKFANVNGTGSSSANGMFMKSLFRMGIPVVGKNYFPSNIQGLPTWYEVRANENGYLAPSGSVDIMVAMNAQTYDEDLSAVEPGGYLIYDSSWPRETLMTRDDITVLGVPLAKMCNEAFDTARARTLMLESWQHCLRWTWESLSNFCWIHSVQKHTSSKRISKR